MIANIRREDCTWSRKLWKTSQKLTEYRKYFEGEAIKGGKTDQNPTMCMERETVKYNRKAPNSQQENTIEICRWTHHKEIQKSVRIIARGYVIWRGISQSFFWVIGTHL